MPDSILIVDDEPGITVALMTRLEAAGFEVYHAINGLAGIEAAAMHKPDAIVLDIRMPDIDGFEVCAQIKQSAELSHTPVIFLSANAQESTRQRAFEAGGSVFLPKPYEASEVIASIRRVIRDADQLKERLP